MLLSESANFYKGAKLIFVFIDRILLQNIPVAKLFLLVFDGILIKIYS
jgi:hypothetical protein